MIRCFLRLGLFLAIAVTVAFAAPVDAASPGSDEPPFVAAVDETVQVVGQHPTPESRLQRLPYHATVQRVEQVTARVLTIADVLDEAAGVRVRRYGGLGAFATASIRGSSPGQVEIYLDGMPLNTAQWGAPNLAELPIDNLASIEIYRGGAPIGFGAPGIGGVVNLVTRDTGVRRTRLAVAGGSYGTLKTTFLSSGPLGRFEHLLTLRHARTHGDFLFLYDPGTPVINDEDDSLLTRQNNRFQETSLLAKITSPPLGPWRFTVQDDWFLKEGGLAGHGNLIYHEAHFDTRRHRASLSADAPVLGSARLGAGATAYVTYNRDRTFNPAHEPGLNFTDLTYHMKGDGAQGRVTVRWFETNQTLNLSGELRRESFVPHDASPLVGTGFERKRRTTNLGLEDEWTPAGGRFSVLAAHRWREASDNYFGPLPFGRPPEERAEPHVTRGTGTSVGARLEVVRGLSFKVNRAADVRFPTLFELFGTGGDVRMNPTLAPESAVTWDTGLSWQAPLHDPARLSLDISAFHSRRDSLIVFVQNAQRNFTAQNLEAALVKGIELHADAMVGHRLGFTGSYTVEEARQETEVPQWDGRWVPYVSPRELFLRTTFRTVGLDLRYEYMYYGRYYQDRANLPEGRVDPRSLHNVGVTWRHLERGITIDLDLQNSLDRTIEDVYGYPMPGRTLYLTVEYALGHRH